MQPLLFVFDHPPVDGLADVSESCKQVLLEHLLTEGAVVTWASLKLNHQLPTHVYTPADGFTSGCTPGFIMGEKNRSPRHVD